MANNKKQLPISHDSTSAAEQKFSTSSLAYEGVRGRGGEREILTSGLFLPTWTRYRDQPQLVPADTRL
jgi:hypothetical protein